MIEVRGSYVYEVVKEGAFTVERFMDCLYHIELEETADGLKARVFDYFGEKQLDKRTIRFKRQSGETVAVETQYGIATLTDPEGRIEVTADDARGAVYNGS